MQTAELVKYSKDPLLLEQKSVQQLQQLVQDFPYFQPAHLLLSLAAKKWDASVYQQSLKKTAIVAPNRSQLFHLIHRLETALETPVAEKKEEPQTVIESEQPVIPAKKEEKEKEPATQEDAQHELNILKAAEIATEEPAAVTEQTAVEETPPEPKKQPDPEEQLEQEIQKGVVNSFVEKEILKTPELHKPPKKEEPENFGDWLALLKKNNGPVTPITENKKEGDTKPTLKPAKKTVTEKTDAEETGSRKEKQKALIDKIIESNPGIIRNREDQKFFAADTKAKESLLENEHLVTETLARIYALQGSVNKAVRAYEILSLKFPQKSAYFATLIQKLKNNP